MIYTLCHKDIYVLNFETKDDEIIGTSQILNEKHIPIGFDNIKSWWKSRSIPNNRQGFKEFCVRLGKIKAEELALKSFGLSLSDCYWVKPERSELRWKDVNFFQNEFSEDIGNALFGSPLALSSLVSPDNTSDGWLKKRWIIKNGERILIKGGSGESQQEPFNEVLATEISKRLLLDCVEYSVIEKEWDYYSLCKDFASENIEFVPASRIYSLKNYTLGLWEKYTHFKATCKLVGIDIEKNVEENVEKNLCGMVLLDYIMANTDRHFGNFGFLRKADTLEWISLSPIFDTGSSMFYNYATSQLSDKSVIDSKNILARPFGYKQADQIKLLPIKKYFSKSSLQKLLGIEDFFESLLLQNKRIDANRRGLLCQILKERMNEVSKLF